MFCCKESALEENTTYTPVRKECNFCLLMKKAGRVFVRNFG